MTHNNYRTTEQRVRSSHSIQIQSQADEEVFQYEQEFGSRLKGPYPGGRYEAVGIRQSKGELTTASPGLKTRFELYFHNSTFCFAVTTPGSESLPRDLMTSMTWGIASLSSCSGVEAPIMAFNRRSYRRRRGMGR